MRSAKSQDKILAKSRARPDNNASREAIYSASSAAKKQQTLATAKDRMAIPARGKPRAQHQIGRR
ncbi:MAG TPA: hypothetical protein DER02_00115 [Gammaproteobacteria bacterium]|nr:hypothetical protein [Gammaproteobacteria bacterium]